MRVLALACAAMSVGVMVKVGGFEVRNASFALNARAFARAGWFRVDFVGWIVDRGSWIVDHGGCVFVF